MTPSSAHIATEMNAALPNAHLEIVPNAGHAIHLEQPRHYLTLVTQFMDDVHEYESYESKEEVA